VTWWLHVKTKNTGLIVAWLQNLRKIRLAKQYFLLFAVFDEIRSFAKRSGVQFNWAKSPKRGKEGFKGRFFKIFSKKQRNTWFLGDLGIY